VPERALSILIATQFAPPSPVSAARRTAGFAKYLSRLGHRVTVLTSLASGRGPIEGAARVVRTRDAVASRVNWRRSHFEALSGGSDSAYREAPTRLASLVVPDLSLLGWLPFALARALDLARRERFDCVVTTSPPESIHLLGLALQRRGIRWIADLRDGWTFETSHSRWPLALQRRLDSALERTVARSADLVSTVTEPLTEDLRERTGCRVVTLTNGFDPEERVRARKEEVGLDPGRFSLVYTGRLRISGVTPEPLLRALSVMDPAARARLEVVVAGPATASEEAALRRNGAAGIVRILGNLERSAALRLQSAADALLIVIPADRPRSVATAKLYEYVATGRPVLVLGEHNAAADIVRETGAGVVTAAEDSERIARDLERLVTSGAYGRNDSEPDIERYSYPRLAARLADEVRGLLDAEA
jgi:Glycosyl transferase 4-like domain/Glycosyl transferases group 1